MSLEPSIAKWAVVLDGDELDLNVARYLFDWPSNTRICEIELRPVKPQTVLISTDFETVSDGWDVHIAAQRVVDFVNGLLFVADLSRSPLRVGSIYERKADGQWSGTSYAAATFTGTARLQALPQLSGAPPHPTWLAGAMRDNVVSDVLAFLRGTPDWFDLYNAFERMRGDINPSQIGKTKKKRPKVKIGWPDTRHFQRSAQVYRHSRTRWHGYDKANAMQISEARAFVQCLAKTWLNWRYAAR